MLDVFLQHIYRLLQLTVHNSARYILYTEKFPAVLLHAGVQYTEQLFYTVLLYSLMMDKQSPKHAAVYVFIILL
jgi:hypothetical protein